MNRNFFNDFFFRFALSKRKGQKTKGKFQGEEKKRGVRERRVRLGWDP